MKLSQIRLLAKDFHKSVTFYKDVMELPLGTYVQEMKYASFKTGETQIEIVPREQMSQVIGENNLPIEVESQSEFFLNFSVEQVDEVCARLKDKGVVFLNEPHDRKEWNARVAHFRDPDGNVIELYKHPL